MDDDRRPDVFINNPYGSGPKIILDVAVMGVNGQSCRSDQDTEWPLRYRLMVKHAQVARQYGFSFIPAIFSHAGQVHQAAMDLTFNFN